MAKMLRGDLGSAWYGAFDVTGEASKTSDGTFHSIKICHATLL